MHLSPMQRLGLMAATTPYRLQIFLPEEVRDVLRIVAHVEQTSMQKLVVKWLLEKLHEYPEGHHLVLPEESSP